jgi:predicted HicB family RNase H-like nuclease
VFAIRVSDEERAAIESAAARAEKAVTQWARDTLLSAAQSANRRIDQEAN